MSDQRGISRRRHSCAVLLVLSNAGGYTLQYRASGYTLQFLLLLCNPHNSYTTKSDDRYACVRGQGLQQAVVVVLPSFDNRLPGVAKNGRSVEEKSEIISIRSIPAKNCPSIALSDSLGAHKCMLNGITAIAA
jgi:hypothetical protein